MARVSDLLRWLAGLPSHCRHCGAPLLAILGRPGLIAIVCPRCDVTPGAQPASLHRRAEALADTSVRERVIPATAFDHAAHRVPIDGCLLCAERAYWGRRAG